MIKQRAVQSNEEETKVQNGVRMVNVGEDLVKGVWKP
jgi:hypothetical protein